MEKRVLPSMLNKRDWQNIHFILTRKMLTMKQLSRAYGMNANTMATYYYKHITEISK